MNSRLIPNNHLVIPKNNNYNNNIIPSNNQIIENINENIINYKNIIPIGGQSNILNNINNQNYINQNRKIIDTTKEIFEQNDNMKIQNNINNFQRIIQDLQYSNSFLNKKNLALESELEFIKNKYNETKYDLDDINNHISICKENQDKIINELTERNNYLEKMISKDNKEDEKIDIKKEEISNKGNNIKLNLFIYKMKQLFNDNNLNEKIKDEDYLNIITNNIIKLKDELNKYQNEIERKNLEINELNKENQLLKIRLQKINHTKRQTLKIPNNYTNYYNSSSLENMKSKSSLEKKQLVSMTNESNYNFDLKDNNSCYSNNQGKIPIYNNKYKPYSPPPLRNNLINNIPKTPKASNFKLHNYNTESFNNSNTNIPYFNRKINSEMMGKKLVNSRSFGSLKFKTLNEVENDKNHQYQYPKATLVNQNCTNSKNSLQTLMYNIAQLENALKDNKNNLYMNHLDNNIE